MEEFYKGAFMVLAGVIMGAAALVLFYPTPAFYAERNKMKVGDQQIRYEVMHSPTGGPGMGLRGYKYTEGEAIDLMKHQAEISNKPLEEFHVLEILTKRIR